MKPKVAAIAMMVLIGCGGPSENDTSAPDATTGDSLELVTDTNLGPVESTQSVTTEWSSVDGTEDASSTSILPAVCLDDSPVEPAQIGTVNTIVVPANTELFDGVVVAVPDTACPGDVVSFVVSIVNTSDEAQPFTPARV